MMRTIMIARRPSLLLTIIVASLMFVFPGSAWSFVVVSPTATSKTCRQSLFLPTTTQKTTVLQRHGASASRSVEPDKHNDDNEEDDDSLRGRMRKLTGFSMTALRASMRALTGVSLTALYITAYTATGAWIRQITKLVLGIFPPPVRYFFQPFLVLYYAPLFILKNLTGPTRKRAIQSHEHVMDGWRSAVEKAEDTVSYWPIHVDKDTGKFESDGTMELEDGIEESVNLVLEKEMEEDVPPLKQVTKDAGDVQS